MEITHTWETAKRYNTKRCKGCGCVSSMLASRVNVKIDGKYDNGWLTDKGQFLSNHTDSRPVIPCRECGRKLFGFQVRGKFNAGKECSDRCMAATGFVCDCKCAGKNHGGAHG